MRERRRTTIGNTKKEYPKAGEIWYCILPEVGGSVQHGHRPVLVVSNNLNNRYSPVVNVLPLTSKQKKEDMSVHVYINEPESCGLVWPSTILAEQLITIPKDLLEDRVGELDKHTRQKVGEAISIQLSEFIGEERLQQLS